MHNTSPLGNNLGPVVGMTLPGVAPAYATQLNDPFISSTPMMPQAFSVHSVQQHAAAVVQKLNQVRLHTRASLCSFLVKDCLPNIFFQ